MNMFPLLRRLRWSALKDNATTVLRWEIGAVVLAAMVCGMWLMGQKHTYAVVHLLAVAGFGTVLLSAGAGLILAQKRVLPTGDWRNKAWAIGGLAFLTLLLRLPFFFLSRPGSDDESTFILLGQDVLNGHLPYTHLWDTKPPLVGLVFGLCLAFAHSVVAVRIGAMVAVLFSGYTLYVVGTRLYGGLAGIWAAILLIVYVSVHHSGQSLMSEHIVLIPLSGILLLAFRSRPTALACLGIGVCFGVAVFTRTNTGLLFPGLVLFAALHSADVAPGSRIRFITALLAGGLIPAAVLVALYAAGGQLPLFFRSLLAPLQLGHVNLRDPTRFIADSARLIGDHVKGGAVMLWAVFALGIAFAWRAPGRDVRRSTLWLLGLEGLLWISIAVMGTRAYHLIPAIPVMALIGGYGVARLCDRPLKWPLYVLIVMGLLLPIRRMAYPGRYIGLVDRTMHHERLMWDSEFQAADWLKQHGADGQYVHLCGGGFQLIYWLTDAKLTSRYADPGVLNMDGVIKAVEGPASSPETVWRGIMDTKPLFLVDRGCSRGGQWVSGHADEVMKAYSFETQVGGANIFRRRQVEPPTPGERP